MSGSEYLKANFTISPAAIAELDLIRREMDRKFEVEHTVLMVGWGQYNFNNGKMAESVIVSFYDKSFEPRLKDTLQIISGMPTVFFVTDRDYDKFEGKLLDFTKEDAFFLS